MFLEETEYGQYGGTLENIERFDALEYQARAFVNRLTFNRIRDETPVREAVKRLTAALIDVLHQEAEAVGAREMGVASVSNDGVSVSYADPAALSGQANARCLALARAYLTGETDAAGIPLLYRGMPR